MNAFCILFADTFNQGEMSSLVNNRTLASVPVASRYRLIDFMLSSLVKSGVPNIGLVVNNNYNSLMDHVGWGKDWDLNRKNSGLKLITPMADTLGKNIPTNKFEGMATTLNYVDSLLQEYCILADGNIISNIDFKDLLRFHEESKADITLAYINKKPKKGENELIFDSKNRVYDSLYHISDYNEERATQVKIHIMTKELYKGITKKGLTLGWENLVRDYVSKNFNKLNVYAYEIKGYCRSINNLRDYFDFNMSLLNDNIRKQVFVAGEGILTRIKDSVPTTYGATSLVKNSVLGDGCNIKGVVENSILFRDVVIEEGAVVRNSIVMTGSVIKKGANIDYVISDRYSGVGENVVLKGNENCQVLIEKGQIV